MHLRGIIGILIHFLVSLSKQYNTNNNKCVIRVMLEIPNLDTDKVSYLAILDPKLESCSSILRH